MIDGYHRAEGEEALKAAKQLLDEGGLSYKATILVGHLGATIAAYAAKEHFNSIVIGTRGMGPIKNEWKLFETVKLPEGKMLIPRVIESKSNFIEHPELIAQRIGRYAKLVGRENVMAGSDCGSTWVGQAAVDPDVVWAKMAAMAEGARIASREFWKGSDAARLPAPHDSSVRDRDRRAPS